MLPTKVCASVALLASLALLMLTCCVGVTSGVVCYQCNSEYDPRCGDPFSPYGLGTVNCSLKDRLEHLRDVEPTLCRKTTQKIFGRVRVVRDCGYLADKITDNRECLKRSGTFEVQSKFCSCSADLCNAAPAGVPHATTAAIGVLVATVVGCWLGGGAAAAMART